VATLRGTPEERKWTQSSGGRRPVRSRLLRALAYGAAGGAEHALLFSMTTGGLIRWSSRPGPRFRTWGDWNSSRTRVDVGGAVRERSRRNAAVLDERDACDELGLSAEYGSPLRRLLPRASGIPGCLRATLSAQWGHQPLSMAGLRVERTERAEKGAHRRLSLRSPASRRRARPGNVNEPTGCYPAPAPRMGFDVTEV
jgi:hypothetical protein